MYEIGLYINLGGFTFWMRLCQSCDALNPEPTLEPYVGPGRANYVNASNTERALGRLRV